MVKYIKNYDTLASTDERKLILDLIDTAIIAIQPEEVINNHFTIKNDHLYVQKKEFNLQTFKRIFLLGFGKGSGEISFLIEKLLGDKLTEGYVIDAKEHKFNKIKFTLGTHPLPSQANLDFTQQVLDVLSKLDKTDLIIMVTCGGGSVMFEKPHSLNLEKLTSFNQALLHAGANIHDMNVMRKHVSKVKGGGLAEHLYPATVINLVFSDVPGDDLSVIASGPLVKDDSTVGEAWDLYIKFKINESIKLKERDFFETPKDDNYFANVHNMLMDTNMTAMNKMKDLATERNVNVQIYSNSFQSDADSAGKKLIDVTPENTILLAGGETTVKVKGKGGEGGRNQELVLAALPYLGEKITIAAIDSDGWDNSPIAGAIGDKQTLIKAEEKNADPQSFLQAHNSSPFFSKVGDAIITDRLSSNVSDLIIVYKKNIGKKSLGVPN